MNGAGAPRPEVPSRVGAVGRAKDAADRRRVVMSAAMWLFVVAALQLSLALHHATADELREWQTEDLGRFVSGFVLLALAALAERRRDLARAARDTDA